MFSEKGAVLLVVTEAAIGAIPTARSYSISTKLHNSSAPASSSLTVCGFVFYQSLATDTAD